MRFAAPSWLWLLALAASLVVLFAWGSYRLERARRLYGEDARLAELVTTRTFGRRFAKAALAILAMVLACLAAAEPQYGKGTRVLPATNLDVVVVLDYSKSMYARDVAPYRMARAKIEVARLVDQLSGARFGAIAFAGEPIAYPLTSDGAAIKQFFRSFDPNDMAVGGTAIARALDAGKDLFARDPRAKNHEKILVLVTDGEDLEGDPVEVARATAALGVRLHVVQIGGRTPEPIPNILESGEMRGYRSDKNGQILTTALTPEGEAQLRAVAEAGGGRLHLAEKGEVGIDALALELRRFMTEELSEKVETVYADVYQYPLAAALLLLLVESFIGTAPFERRRSIPPKGERRRRKPRRLARTASVALVAFGALGCDDYDRLFLRKSPVVEEAITALTEKNSERAIELLTTYLETGACESGVLGAGDRAKKYGDASFDLGLALHGHAKTSSSSPPPAASATLATPAPGVGDDGSIDCALRVLAPLADDEKHDVALRARVLYLMGNLELSRKKFRDAVSAFDRGLALAPGSKTEDGLDPIGNDLAHNRAYALRNALEEERKKEEEKKRDESSKDDEKKGSEDEKKQDPSEKSDPGDEKSPNPEKNEGEEKPSEPEQKHAGDGEKSPSPDPNSQGDDEGKNAPPESTERPSAGEDERVLEMLEQAPTLQQEDAKKRQRARRARPTMEDK